MGQSVNHYKQFPGSSMDFSELSPRALLNASAAAVLLLHNSYILMANNAAANLTGSPAEKLDNTRFAALFDPESQQRLGDKWSVDAPPAPVELQLALPNQALRWVECTLLPIPYQGETVWSATLVDISERKRLADEHQYTAQLLEMLVEYFPGGSVLLIDKDLRYHVAGGRDAEVYKQMPIVGKTMYEVVPPDFMEPSIAMVKAALAGEPQVREFDYAGSIYLIKCLSVVNRVDNARFALVMSENITKHKQLENVIQQNETRYRLLAENIMDVVVMTDEKGEVIYISPSVERVLGYKADELMGEVGFSIIHADDQHIILEGIGNIDRETAYMPAEFRALHRDGHYIWCESQGMVVFDDNGKITTISVLRDITDRKQFEHMLAESEALFRSVFESAAIGVSTVRVDTSEMGYINPTLERMLGYTTPELANKTYRDFTHPADQPAEEELVRRLMEGGLPYYQHEKRFIRRDGSLLWVRVTVSLMKGVAGDAVHGIVIVEDIHARREMGEELRRSESQLRLITDHVEDIITQTDTNSIIQYVSPSFYRILGFKPDEVIGRSVFEFIHADDLPAIVEQMQAGYEQRGSNIASYRNKMANGDHIWLETTGSLLFDPNGTASGAVFLSRDITERRAIERAALEEERLRTALQKESELSNLKTRMMIRISHEFRTPLSVIQLAADMIEHYGSRLPPEKLVARYKSIWTQINHLTRMLDDLNLTVRGIAKYQQFTPYPFDLMQMLEENIQTLRQGDNERHPTTLTFDGESTVVADERLIQLVLRHLVANAFKYSPVGIPVQVEIHVNTEMLQIHVRDQGVGILPQEQEQVFEPLFRGSNIGEIAGLGVGLGIVRDAVAVHGGIVTLESEPGKGTTVNVILPLGAKT